MMPYNYKAIEKKWRENIETQCAKKVIKGSVLEKYTEIRQMHESRRKHPVEFSQDLYWDYGTDAVQMYEMFAEPDDGDQYWDDGGLDGIYRFLTRFWRMAEAHIEAEKNTNDSAEAVILCGEMIREIEKRLARRSPSTAISVLMEYTRKLSRIKMTDDTLQKAICLLAPFAPYLAQELWERCENAESVMDALWPTVSAEEIAQMDMEIPVQVNGVVRGKISVTASDSEELVWSRAEEILQKYCADQKRKKEIYVPGRILSVQI